MTKSQNFLNTLISDVPEQIEQEETQPVTTALNYQIAVPAVAASGPPPPAAAPLPPVVHPPPPVEKCKNSEKGFTFLILLSILVK